MTAQVSIIMGSTSDLPVMEKACKLLDEMQVPFEVNALSAHRTPDAVEQFARTAKERGTDEHCREKRRTQLAVPCDFLLDSKLQGRPDNSS